MEDKKSREVRELFFPDILDHLSKSEGRGANFNSKSLEKNELQ